MKCVSVTYTQRRVLGQYEHEDISVTLTPDADEQVTAEALMAEARRVVVQATTQFLKAQRERMRKQSESTEEKK